MKIELPIADPVVRCFLFDAVPLSIMGVDKKYEPWFLSNYIQLCCRKNILDRKELFLQFYGPDQGLESPFINKQYCSWEVISKSNIDIVEYIILNINQKYYFWGYVDDYYVPFRGAYKKKHTPHDIFIYGYDNSLKVFYVLVYNQDSSFAKSEITFDEFRAAFYNNIWDKSEYYWIDRMYFLQYNQSAEYEMDLCLIQELLEDYLYSRNSSMRYRRYSAPIEDSRFGMDVYEGIREYFKLLLDGEIGNDRKVLFLFWEHKMCMSKRFYFLSGVYKAHNFQDVYERYKQVEIQANIVLSLSLKYEITGNKKIILKVIEIIDIIEKVENEILHFVIKNFGN